MPKALERKLMKEVKKKGLTGDRRDAYIYGTLSKIEKKSHERKESKHK